MSSASLNPDQCLHKEQPIVFKKKVDGSRMFFRQCLCCGMRTTQQLPTAKVMGNHILPFDEELEKTGQELRWTQLRAKNEQERARQNAEWWAKYDAHLKSDKWSYLRCRVLNRSNGLCEGCGERPAAHVHHLTYDHLGDELLFELVAVCRECHRKIHPERWQEGA